MRSRHTLPWFLPTLLLATLAAACSKSPTTPTDVTPTTQSEIYTGQLTVGGSQFYSFTTVTAGTTDITLTGLRPLNGPSAPFSAAIGVGLGIPQGTDCALSNAITTTPGLSKQLSVATNVSIYCVKIADIGQLTGPIEYTVRVVHP
jgi:hypothetical protein